MSTLLEQAKKLKAQQEKNGKNQTKTIVTSPKNEGKKNKDKKRPQKKRGKKSKSRNPSQSFKPTLDLDRGIYRLFTNIGDKTMTKTELERKIAEKLTDKQAMATLLRNLASYLESA